MVTRYVKTVIVDEFGWCSKKLHFCFIDSYIGFNPVIWLQTSDQFNKIQFIYKPFSISHNANHDAMIFLSSDLSYDIGVQGV